MSLDCFTAMEYAVAIVNDSEHKKNKIAACLFRGDNHITRFNQRAAVLADHFPPDVRIGQSSQFIHAEVACLFQSHFATEGASLCVTDPFCPNCAKAICEAGITHVYIDHKGLDKDFAKRRGDDFESLSLLMMEKAGIAVSILHRKEKRLTPLIAPPVSTRTGSAQGIEFFDWDDTLSHADYLKNFRNRQMHGPWALAKIKEADGSVVGILIFEKLTHGLTIKDYENNNDNTAKYRFPVDPLNRLMFFIKRKNFTVVDDAVSCNLHPSSRALVNACGFGIKTIFIAEATPDHDIHGIDAGRLLQDNGLLSLTMI